MKTTTNKPITDRQLLKITEAADAGDTTAICAAIYYGGLKAKSCRRTIRKGLAGYIDDERLYSFVMRANDIYLNPDLDKARDLAAEFKSAIRTI